MGLKKWFLSATIISITLIQQSTLLLAPPGNSSAAPETSATSPCRRKSSDLISGDELSCSGASILFFRNFNIPSNRTQWLTCENCTLPLLDENTFKMGRNSLTYIYLIKSKIRTIKAATFTKFPGLKSLSLRENSVESLDAKFLLSLRKLLQLDLSGNQLKILTNNLFEQAPNLDLLNLNNNRVFYIQPECFAGLKNLKYLYLSGNQLAKLEANIFRHLPSLVILYLEDNRIEEIDSLAFINLSKLTALYLNNNTINYLVQYNFKPLTSLSDLQLRNNNLSEIQISSFNGLTNLKLLYLGRNQLRSIKPYGLIGLNNLASLELIGNDFEYFDLECLKNMENLRVLWLQHNRLSNFSVGYKSDVLGALESIGLNSNNLSALNLKILHHKVPNLKDVFISNNSWQCEALVNMYNFSLGVNISLCVTSDCNLNRTKSFVEDVCDAEGSAKSFPPEDPEDTEDDFADSDFVASRGGAFFLSLFAPLIVLFFKCFI